MLNSASITTILWWYSDMETSDSLDIRVGGVGVVSFDVEWLVVMLECLSVCVDVVGAHSVDGSFDGSL